MNKKRSTTITLIVLVMLIAGGAGAYYGLFSSSAYGTVSIGIKDQPVQSISHLYLTISNIELQGNENSTSTFQSGSTSSFDLLSLVNVSKMLGSASVRPGNYTMIRFTVVSAIASIAGQNVTLNVPSDEVKVPIHFEITSGKVTTIILDITADNALISSSMNFRPVVTGQVQ
jgi:Domain of unknown function (DUF4382)